jgi:WD40 repeat protein
MTKTVEELKLTRIVGGVQNACKSVLISDESIVYAIGSVCIIQNINSDKQRFFTGHDAAVTSLAFCPTAKFCVSGQKKRAAKKFAPVFVFDPIRPETTYFELQHHTTDVDAVGISQSFVFTICGDPIKQLHVWKLSDLLSGFSGKAAAAYSIASLGKELIAPEIVASEFFSPDELQVCTFGSTLRLWRLSKYFFFL